MKTPEEIFEIWQETLRSPDDSLFYHHPGLDRILLSLAIFTISSEPVYRKLGKNNPLSLLNIYVNDLITAWIDEDDETFEQMFPMTMTVAEVFMISVFAKKKEQPSKEKDLVKLANFYSYAVACGGDMREELAESLLDDITTDGKRIFSPKVKEFGTKILKLMQIHGPELTYLHLHKLNGYPLLDTQSTLKL